MYMGISLLLITYLLGVIASKSERFGEHFNIDTAPSYMVGIGMIISFLNGYDPNLAYSYNFESMKTFNALILILAIAAPFNYFDELNTYVVLPILTLFFMVLFNDYFLSLEPYGRVTILLITISMFLNAFVGSVKTIIRQ